jgi:pilus assembly protein Flp/PilA
MLTKSYQAHTERFAMIRLVRRVKRFLLGTEGASMTEYAFLLALLALAVLGAITLLGQSISSLFSKLATLTQGLAP